MQPGHQNQRRPAGSLGRDLRWPHRYHRHRPRPAYSPKQATKLFRCSRRHTLHPTLALDDDGTGFLFLRQTGRVAPGGRRMAPCHGSTDVPQPGFAIRYSPTWVYTRRLPCRPHTRATPRQQHRDTRIHTLQMRLVALPLYDFPQPCGIYLRQRLPDVCEPRNGHIPVAAHPSTTPVYPLTL